jgi:hypothetical protein
MTISSERQLTTCSVAVTSERRTITFRLPIQQLAFIGRNNRPVVEPGDFDVMIGGLTTRLVVQ